MNPDDDWFAAAADAVAAGQTEAQRRIAELIAESRAKGGFAPPPSAAELAAAKHGFGIPTTVRHEQAIRESRFRKPTPEQGLDAIIAAITESDDPFKASGEWLTKVTNAITGAVRNLDDED